MTMVQCVTRHLIEPKLSGHISIFTPIVDVPIQIGPLGDIRRSRRHSKDNCPVVLALIGLE